LMPRPAWSPVNAWMDTDQPAASIFSPLIVYSLFPWTYQSDLSSIVQWDHSLRWKFMSKSTVRWFIVREKHCSGWKNKLKSTDYKTSEQSQCFSLTIKQHQPTY
jgi:hypothetical protein